MIKLNDTSIYVGYIKQLLHSFNLPMFPLYVEDYNYSVGEHYLKNNEVYVVTKDGDQLFKYYKEGEFIPNLTTILPIASNIYDSQTHVYLGNYLRFLRDYLGMDLMSLYNCCCYDSPRDFKATCLYDGGSVEFNSEDTNYTIIMIPVKWGREYTIGIDFHGELEMGCIHYDSNSILETVNEFGGYNFIDGTYLKVRGARFNHPFIYDNLTKDNVNLRKQAKGDPKESTLKLMIRIPTSCTSSIVVLEGNYIKCSNENMYMDEYKQKLGDSPIIVGGVDPETGLVRTTNIPMLNYDYVNKNQLLSINLGQKTLLADRLVEYLSQQAIAPNSDVVDNIKRAQRTLLNKLDTYAIYQYGIWDEGMKQSIYKYNWTSGIIHNYDDMISYFDKDVETKIGGLLTKYSELDPKHKVFTYGEVGGK